MADGRRNKGTAKHAGVVFQRRALPSGAVSWRARYTDPDTGKVVWETLPAVDAQDEAARTRWALAKKAENEDRAKDIAKGAPTKKGGTLEAAVERYFADVKAGLREKTIKAYGDATNAMLAWARAQGIESGDELRGEHLAALRAHLVNKPRHAQASGKGKGRGKRTATTRKRSPRTVNRELRSIKTVLSYLRRLGLVPLVTRDAIMDNLELVPESRPVPVFLKPTEIVKLIEAAGRHDADLFDLTRDEKARGLIKGSTPRYPAILPYLALVLLSGMRADEARLLRWDAVDLTAAPAGIITLRPDDVKTKHGRQVDLVVSPALASMLALLRLRAGRNKFVFGDLVTKDKTKSSTVEPALTRAAVEAARKRLVRAFGSPRYSWQQLRVTCGTYLTNAPGIFGAASAYRSARQLGHSVTIAEKHYLGVVHVDPNAKTLEAAMKIEELLRKEFRFEQPSETSSASGG